MQGYNICKKYIKIVAEMNKSNTTRIKAGNILTRAVPTTTAIKQEDSLSHIFFNEPCNERDNKERKDKRYRS
jgi:hypothetical protein